MTDTLPNQEVQGLIEIIDGGIKEVRRHWYTLGIKIHHRYSLNEQLDAVRKLGLSKNKIALDYIRKLNLSEQVDNGLNTSWDGWGDTCYDLVYPHAGGELKETLELRMTGGLTSPASCSDHPRRAEAGTILAEALSILEASLK